MMRFFFFSFPGLLKPWFVYLLDGTTLTGMVQTYTSVSALSRNGRWHSQAICWPFFSAPHAQAWNNMTLRWSESINMLQTKAEVNINIVMVGLWVQLNLLGCFSASNIFHNINNNNNNNVPHFTHFMKLFKAWNLRQSKTIPATEPTDKYSQLRKC